MRKMNLAGKVLGTSVALAIMTAGCRDTQSADQTPGKSPAATSSQIIMHPTEKTIERLRNSDRWAVAALRSEQVTITGAGTRSQTMTLEAIVLQATDPKLPSPLNLEQYVANDAILDQGKIYLVILAGTGGNGDDPVAWNIIQRGLLNEAAVEEEVSRLLSEIKSKLK